MITKRTWSLFLLVSTSLTFDQCCRLVCLFPQEVPISKFKCFHINYIAYQISRGIPKYLYEIYEASFVCLYSKSILMNYDLKCIVA